MIQSRLAKPNLSGLGIRLMAVMGVALLPLALLSYVQTLETERVADSRARAAILGETLAAAEPQTDLINSAEGAAKVLAAAVLEHGDTSGFCTPLVRRLVNESGGAFSFAGFIRTSGAIQCTSAEAPYEMSNDAWLDDMVNNPRERLTVNRNAPISNTSVLNLSLPVYQADGALLGFSSISMPQSELARRDSGEDLGNSEPLALITFDPSGEILTSSNGLDAIEQMLPQSNELSKLAQLPGHSFIDTTITGRQRAFAVITISPGALYLLGSWPADKLNDHSLSGGFPAATFPMLMWAASLLVAYLAAESQVIRHIRSLHNSITAFAGGNRRLRPIKTSGAATELREVAEAYEKMTEAILQDEAHLENIIHQKEVLLREVHHRVKNNLQLIASILNMQLRSAKTAEAKLVMKGVQERVLSLATIHRELYQTTGQADIRANELLPKIVRDILKIGAHPSHNFDLDIAIDNVHLTPDQAVPLSLFLTEGMANVLKHAKPKSGHASHIGLRLSQLSDREAELILTNSLHSETGASGSGAGIHEEQGEGFGAKLLAAFAGQLDGRMIRQRGPETYTLVLRFPLRALVEAEERVTLSDKMDAI